MISQRSLRKEERRKRWSREHPDALGPEPYTTAYRVLSLGELRAMLPHLRHADNRVSLDRLNAINTHLRARGATT